MSDYRFGDVVWVEFDPTVGREQRGRRPAMIVSSDVFSMYIDTLVAVLPMTTTDRGWLNHVAFQGAGNPSLRGSFVMTEQIRTISIDRIHGRCGQGADTCLREVTWWLDAFIGVQSKH